MRDTVWIFDSDVDCYCLNDWSVFTIWIIDGNEVVETANNQRIPVENSENAEIFIETNTLRFTNILFISGFMINLISVCMLNNHEIFMFFEINKTASLIVCNNIFIVFVNYTYNQFVFHNQISILSIISSSFNSFVLVLNNKSANIFIWHRRLIHINYHHIINDNKKIIDLYYHDEISIHLCESCFLNKQKTFISRMFITKIIFFWITYMSTLMRIFFKHFEITNISCSSKMILRTCFLWNWWNKKMKFFFIYSNFAHESNFKSLIIRSKKSKQMLN